MRANRARIIWSHCRLSIVDLKADYDAELFPYAIELGAAAPCVALLKAFVQLTTEGLRPKHVASALCDVDEFIALFNHRDRERMRRVNRLASRGISV
jgi:hypothetical protein